MSSVQKEISGNARDVDIKFCFTMLRLNCWLYIHRRRQRDRPNV